MKKEEIFELTLTEDSVEKQIKAEPVFYLVLSTSILEGLHMFGPQEKQMYARMNARKFFVQKRPCLVEQSLLRNGVFYSLLKEINGRKLKIKKKIVMKGEHTGSKEKKIEGQTIKVGDIKKASKKRRQHCQKTGCSLVDPLIAIFVLINKKRFHNFVFKKGNSIFLNGLKLDSSINFDKFLVYLANDLNEIGISNILGLNDDRLSLLLYHASINKDAFFKILVVKKFDLAKQIVSNTSVSQPCFETFLTACEGRESFIVDILNTKDIEEIEPSFFHLFVKYRKQIKLEQVLKFKRFIDKSVKNKEYAGTYDCLFEELVTNKCRVNDVLLLDINEEVEEKTKKLLCRLVKSNVDIISKQIQEQAAISIRTAMRLIVTESWEHLLFIYVQLIATFDDMSRFVFECELFQFIFESYENMNDNNAEIRRKHVLRLRKGAKFIDLMVFEDPQKSILLNSLKSFLEELLTKNIFSMVRILKGYCHKRNDFNFQLLKNFRRDILEYGELELKEKLALIDLYYELLQEKGGDSIDSKGLMKDIASKKDNYPYLTPLEIKSVSFGPNVVEHIKGYEKGNITNFFQARNFILFTSYFLQFLEDIDWIEGTLMSIKIKREDLSLMIKSLVSLLRVRQKTIEKGRKSVAPSKPPLLARKKEKPVSTEEEIEPGEIRIDNKRHRANITPTRNNGWVRGDNLLNADYPRNRRDFNTSSSAHFSDIGYYRNTLPPQREKSGRVGMRRDYSPAIEMETRPRVEEGGYSGLEHKNGWLNYKENVWVRDRNDSYRERDYREKERSEYLEGYYRGSTKRSWDTDRGYDQGIERSYDESSEGEMNGWSDGRRKYGRGDSDGNRRYREFYDGRLDRAGYRRDRNSSDTNKTYASRRSEYQGERGGRSYNRRR